MLSITLAALVGAGDAEVLAVLGYGAPCDVDSLGLEDVGELIVSERFAGIFFFDQLLDAPHLEADDPAVALSPEHVQAGRYRLRVGVVAIDERLPKVTRGRVPGMRFEAL